MILILSEETDQATNKVIDWLYSTNHCFKRINNEGYIDKVSLFVNNDINIKNGSERINLKNVDSFWYRRGALKIDTSFFHSLKDEKMKRSISDKLSNELAVLFPNILSVLEKKRSLGNFQHNFINKLSVLEAAKMTGLTIPETLVTTSLTDVKNFISKHGHIITKPISEIFLFADSEKAFISRTMAVDDNLLTTLPETFFPMLFQEQLNKKFELRVFFINNDFYATAIFSQNNEKTKTDWRNDALTCRMVPFQLPKSVLKKLKILIRRLSMNTGSIDFIYSTTNKYVFLEINPVGQFGAFSERCNYHLEKEVANFLINNKNE